MPRRCILHVGMPKTGSSALQASLHRAAPELLARHGIGYATEFENHSVIGVLTGHSSDAAQSVRRRMKYRIWDDAAFRAHVNDSFAAHFDRCGTELEILSGEGLGQGYLTDDIARLADFLDQWFDDIRVCAFVRPPLAHFNSRAQQVLKRGMTFDAIRAQIDAFKAGAIPPDESCVVARPKEGLSPYIEVFGPDAVTIRDARRSALIGGDVVDDFTATMLDCTPEDLGMERVSVNESLNATAAHMLEAVNRQVPAWLGGYPNPRRARGLLGHLRALPGAQPFVMAGIDWADLQAATDYQVSWIAEVTQGRIDYSAEPLPAQNKTAAPDPDLDAIARLLNDSLVETQEVKARMRIQAASHKLAASDAPLPAEADLIRRSARFLTDAHEMLRAGRKLLRGGYPEEAATLCSEIAHTAPDPAHRGAAFDLLGQVHAHSANAANM